MSTTLIWDDLKNGASMPICTREELVKLEEGILINVSLCPFPISAVENEYLLKVFDFKDPESLPLYGTTKIIITQLKQAAINSFINANNLTDISHSIFQTIATINQEVSAIRCHKAAEEKVFGPRLKRHYEKDKNTLAQAVKQYCDCYLDNGELDASILSIAFTFSHQSESLKITNDLLIRDIMDCIRMSYNFNGPPISFDFETLETSFKKQTAKGLFELFQLPNTSWYVKKKVNAYKVIADIFKLADIKVGEIDEEVIKTWIKRANL